MVEWEGTGNIYFPKKLLKPSESAPPNIWLSNLQLEDGTTKTMSSDFFHYLGCLPATNILTTLILHLPLFSPNLNFIYFYVKT